MAVGIISSLVLHRIAHNSAAQKNREIAKNAD